MSEDSAEARRQPDPTAWGQPISEERQSELLAQLTYHLRSQVGDSIGAAETRGAFAGSDLTGADVSWLAQHFRAAFGADVVIHLEGARMVGAHLEGAHLTQAHLERANMSGAYLEHAHLTAARLTNANFTAARLTDAHLGYAHLEGAKLSSTQLAGAHLSYAHLEGADLTNAHLEGAHLNDAHLEGANLHSAYLQGAHLRECWLSSATVLTNASLDDTTKLADIHWAGVGAVDLTQIAWDRVPRLGDERRVGLRASSKRHAATVRAYRQLAAQLRAQGMTDVADRFSYRAQIRQRYFYLRTLLEDWRRPLRLPGDLLRYFGSFTLAILAGYGYRPGRTIALYFVFIAFFAAMYFAYGTGCHITSPHDVVFTLARQIRHSYACTMPPDQPMTWNEAFVVSFTAFHGRGFLATAIKPGDPQAALAAAEAVLGLIIEISFIATFTQRFFGAK